MADIFYFFELSYAKRSLEKPFIKAILNNFSEDEIYDCCVYVNNSPYNLQFHLEVFFVNEIARKKFDEWLRENFPDKIIKRNIRSIELLRSGNAINFNRKNFDMIDFLVNENSSFLFFFVEENRLQELNPSYKKAYTHIPKIFLSHSSLDKEKIVEPIYEYLQSRQIPVWLDKYEIDYGDNIYQKVSEGIDNSEFAIFVVTENFFDSKWAKEELSSMIDLVFNDNSLVIVDMKDKTDIPKLISSRKYMEWNNGCCLNDVVDLLNRKLKL